MLNDKYLTQVALDAQKAAKCDEDEYFEEKNYLPYTREFAKKKAWKQSIEVYYQILLCLFVCKKSMKSSQLKLLLDFTVSVRQCVQHCLKLCSQVL